MNADVDAITNDLKAMLEKYNPEGIPLEGSTKLDTDLNIDSVEVMDLIMEIEDHYEVDIPINLLSDIHSLGELASLVCSRIDSR